VSTLILCFHRVADPEHGGRSMLAISPDDFRSVLEIVGRRYEFVDLETGAKPSTRRQAVVTFDDGYADNLHTAAPILEKLGIPATFFISTGFIGTKNLYPPDALDAFYAGDFRSAASPELQEATKGDYWGALEEFAAMESSKYWRLVGETSGLVRDVVLEQDSYRRPMTLEELTALDGFDTFTIGPHTVTHRRLSAIGVDAAAVEVQDSASWLRDHGIEAVPYFAYPYGQTKDMDPAVSAFSRAQGYEPLTTLPTLVTRISEGALKRWGLPRLSVGPAEVPLVSPLVALLPVMSAMPRLWLALLALRRRLIASRL